MQRFKQKKLYRKQDKEHYIKQAYRKAIDHILENQNLKILIEYSKELLKNLDISKIQNLNDYTPVSISRLIFGKQLDKIKEEIMKLPYHQCPYDIFLIIMLKVVKFPFEKAPFYLLGLQEMFRLIKENQSSEYVTYEQIHNYVMGEVVNLSEEHIQDTEFQIQFKQNKMQDFLMHDNGVKKIVYSNDLKKYIVLDSNSNVLKIYDENMKMVSKFLPNKQKHNKKQPAILTFDYNQFGSKLAVSIANKTFSIINLEKLLNAASQEAFHCGHINQIVYKSSANIQKIFFLSMMNKWLCIDQQNKIWIYDVQNFKQEDEKFCKKFKHPNDDYEISSVCELVSLSAIAFVIHNEIWFFNEALSKKKFKKFSHFQEIKKLVYQEEKNQFYLVGKEQKNISIFSLNKVNGEPGRIQVFHTNQVIIDFDIFPFYNALLILDSKHNLKVYSLDEPILQYEQNYNFIVKKKQLSIKLLKYSKTSFLIHATYILVMQLKKTAIEKDLEFFFKDTFYWDSSKQQIVFSVNGQILGLSLMHGQIRKNIAPQNSNINKHQAFHIARKNQLFVIDQNDSIYQVLSKNDTKYKDLKDYRKQMNITDIKKTFYDEEYNMVIVISESSIHLIRNNSNGNFSFKSCLILQNSTPFSKYRYYLRTKQLVFLDFFNTVYLMKNYSYEFHLIFQVNVFKQENESEKILVDVEYDEDIGVLMILTNNGQFALFDVNDPSKILYIRIKDLLPHKLKYHAFNNFSYQKRTHNDRTYYHSRVYFHDQTGMIIEFILDNMIYKIVDRQQIFQKCLFVSYKKDTNQVDMNKLKKKQFYKTVNLEKEALYEPNPKQYIYIKAHDKEVVFSKRIFLQDYYLLTIGEDGHIKLWGQNRQLYFDLKIPLMLKIQWNMAHIHQKRNIRIITETIKYLEKLSQIMKQNQQKQIVSLGLRQKIKYQSEKIKLNLDNSLLFEIQNKELQEIINKRQIDMRNMTIDVVRKSKQPSKRRMNFTQKVNEPWKKKKQFKEIYRKASTIDKYLSKYKEKMPFDLLLMRHDLHMDQNSSVARRKSKEKEEPLIILPQLKKYLKSKQLEKSIEKTNVNPEDKKSDGTQGNSSLEEQANFQSCLFVKTERGPKKSNAFDEIDKYFWKKQHENPNKKWIPNKKNLMRDNQTIEPKAESSISNFMSRASEHGKLDPLKMVLKIFEEHNKEALGNKKARLIKIPKLSNHSIDLTLKRT